MIKHKKAQVGLDVFLNIIAMIFVIGIIIMAFVLAGASFMNTDQAFSTTGAYSVADEGHLMNGTIGYFDLTNSNLRNVICSVSSVSNATDGINIKSGNYTTSNCRITEVGIEFENYTWNVNYTYNYEIPNTASIVINDTSNAVGEATNWFAIFITIAAVVVLILLIVLIVVSLRKAGLMGGGNNPGA